jgi:hypothetical protein
MAEYTNHQRKIIDRYYANRDAIMLTKVQELVTELYLADTDKKKDALWKRVRTALGNLKIKPDLVEHIVTKRDPTVLARNLQDWMKNSGN